MKKLLSLSLAFVMALALAIPAFATSASDTGQTITFNEDDYVGFTLEETGAEKLRDSGYSAEFIATIPIDTLQKIGASSTARQSVSYHKEAIIADGSTDLVKISKAEYETAIDAEMQARVEEIASKITVVDADGNPVYEPEDVATPATVTKSLNGGKLTVRTTMFQAENGLPSQYLMLAEYEWVTPPTYRGSDYFGITRDSNCSMIPGSFGNSTFFREYRYFYLATNAGVQSALNSTNDFSDNSLPNEDSAATGFIIKVGMPVDVNPPASMLVGSSFLSRNYANMSGGVWYEGTIKTPSIVPQSFNNYSTYWHQDSTKLFGGFSLNVPFGASFSVTPEDKFSTPVEDVILAIWDKVA